MYVCYLVVVFNNPLVLARVVILICPAHPPPGQERLKIIPIPGPEGPDLSWGFPG